MFSRPWTCLLNSLTASNRRVRRGGRSTLSSSYEDIGKAALDGKNHALPAGRFTAISLGAKPRCLDDLILWRRRIHHVLEQNPHRGREEVQTQRVFSIRQRVQCAFNCAVGELVVYSYFAF